LNSLDLLRKVGTLRPAYIENINTTPLPQQLEVMAMIKIIVKQFKVKAEK
jgi:hypothetical protein